MTDSLSLWGAAEETANRIREQIKSELGFTANIGVSENKLLAKMASDFRKPNRVHTLWKKEVPIKMWPLPVSDLFFVGRATFKKLYMLGIYTIGDLAAADPLMLKSHLKKHGEVIWDSQMAEMSALYSRILRKTRVMETVQRSPLT